MPNQTPIPTQLNIAPSGMTWKNWKLVHGTDGFPTRETMEKYLCNPDRVRDLEECRDLNRQTIKQLEALIQLYEAQMEAIGAGGVEPLRKREKLHQIAEPVTAGTAVRAFRDYLGVHDGIKLGGQAMDDIALDLARIALDFKHLVEPQHPDDAAVDALAVLMKAKLAKQRAKGYGGWNDKTQCPQQRLSDMLRAHVDKGDPVDVANFCAMLSARGEGIAAAPQAVQAAVPTIAELEASAELGALRDVYEMARGVLRFDGIDMERALKYKDGLIEAIETVKTIDGGTWEPAHPAEGVPAQASEWDGKLPERLQSVLNALRLGLPAAVVNDVEFEVRSHYEAMHTSLSTSRRMYGAARDRLEAIDAAQPDPFAATQPAAQGMDVVKAAKALCKHAAKVQNINFDDYWLIHAEEFKEEAQIVLDAAQAKQGGDHG